MSSETRIVVLKMKELIYILLFVLFAAVLILLAVFMVRGRGARQTMASADSLYQPGVYTVSVALGDSCANLCVTVDSDHINNICFENLSESISTSYPLAEPALEKIRSQVISAQTVSDIAFDDNMKYTESYILEMITQALEKASSAR